MMELFLSKLGSEGKSTATLNQYRSNLGRFADWLKQTPHQGGTGGVPGLGNATQLDISNFKKWITKNYKASTVKQNLNHLRAFYSYLVEQGQIPDNPFNYIKIPQKVELAPKWLDRNEQNSLIRAVRKYGNLRDLTIVTLFLHTGLRVNELCNVTRGRVTRGRVTRGRVTRGRVTRGRVTRGRVTRGRVTRGRVTRGRGY